MLQNALLQTLQQAQDILEILGKLPEEKQTEVYNHAGIGRHFRHIADHIQAFINGAESGLLNYNFRQRGHGCETALNAGKIHLSKLKLKLDSLDLSDRDITVISEIDLSTCHDASFKSSLAREILYIINHTIHHTAYIKLLAQTKDVMLPDHIGLAPATATFLRKAS